MRIVVSLLLYAAAPLALAQIPPAFPAQQRAPGDPALVSRGAEIYGVHCRACHGADLRGGDMGGPNLLRSQLVLNDLEGEAIGPVVKAGRVPEGGGRPMPPLPLPDADLKAVSLYIHSIIRTSQPQGAPPAGAPQQLKLLVGNARAGQRYFAANCTSCHAADGDMAGIGARLTDTEQLQNTWVAGRRAGPPGSPAAGPPAAGAAAANARPPRRAQVRVSLAGGDTVAGTLERMDDFRVSLRTADGQYRSFARSGGTPAVTSVEVDDPLAGHRKLWTRLTNADMHNVTAYLASLK